MTTVILRTLQSEDKTAPLKLTIPESWAGAPLSKLIKAWSKRKQCTGEVYLASADGTPIPEDWPWEAAVELYGSTLRVGERHDDEAPDDVAKRRDDDAAGSPHEFGRGVRPPCGCCETFGDCQACCTHIVLLGRGRDG